MDRKITPAMAELLARIESRQAGMDNDGSGWWEPRGYRVYDRKSGRMVNARVILNALRKRGLVCTGAKFGWYSVAMIQAAEAEAYTYDAQIGEAHTFTLDEMASRPFNGVICPSFATFAAVAIEQQWFTEIVIEHGPDAYGNVVFRAWDKGFRDAAGNWTVAGRWVRYEFWSSRSRQLDIDDAHAYGRFLTMVLGLIGAFVPNPEPGSRVREMEQLVKWERRHNVIGQGTESWYVAFLADEAQAHADNARRDAGVGEIIRCLTHAGIHAEQADCKDPHYASPRERETCAWCDSPAVVIEIDAVAMQYGTDFSDKPKRPLCTRHAYARRGRDGR